MGKRVPAPTVDQIDAAVSAACAGKGRRLAEMVKGFSLEDLASAFGHIGPNHPVAFHGLSLVLCFAAGRKGERAQWATVFRRARSTRRAKA